MTDAGRCRVPGLLARPGIDIMVGTQPSYAFEAMRETLVKIGYEDMGTGGVEGRI